MGSATIVLKRDNDLSEAAVCYRTALPLVSSRKVRDRLHTLLDDTQPDIIGIDIGAYEFTVWLNPDMDWSLMSVDRLVTEAFRQAFAPHTVIIYGEDTALAS